MSDHYRDYALEAERQIAAAAEREIKLEARLMGAHREVGALTWKLEKANEAISELRAMLERAHTDLEAA